MKQQNYLFVDIVTALFLLIIFIGNFLGLLFITNGNSVLSMLGSIFLVVCYHFVIKLLAKNKELMVNSRYLHGSSVFWAFFLILGFTSYSLMSHFINIEYNCKAKIQNEVNEKLQLVESFSTTYAKRAKADLLNYQVQLEGLQNDKNVALAMLEPKRLVIEASIQYLDTTISAENAKFKGVFDNWKRFSLMNNYDRLNEYVESNLNTVNAKLKALPVDKSPLKNVEYDTSQLPLNNPLELNKKFEPDFTVPLATVLLTHLFILIPFFSKRIPKRLRGEEPEGAVIL